MADAITPPRMTEPQVIDCQFVEGVSLETHDTYVRLVGWVDLEVVEEDVDPERRIVARMAMPLLTARALLRDLRKSLQGRH